MPLPAADMSSKKEILAHGGFAFRHIWSGILHTIVTHNIVQDFDESRIPELKAAAHRLVDRNPILSGNLRSSGVDSTTGKRISGVFVQPGTCDELVHQVATPENIPSPVVEADTDTSSTLLLQRYVQTYIDPLLPGPKKAAQEIQQQLPVFQIHYMILPDNHVYFCFCVSHAVADGATYYMLLQEFNAILNQQRLPPPIQWEQDVATQFALSHQVWDPFFWIGFIMLMVVSKLWGLPPARQLILSKAKIAAKKKELLALKNHKNDNNVSFLSTNDIVTAAIKEQTARQYDLCMQIVNFRQGRWPGADDRDGGNIHKQLPLTNQTTNNGDPLAVRRATNSLRENPLQNLPFFSMFTGKTYLQTNWASLQTTVDGTIFHTPLPRFVGESDAPIVVIYQPNQQEIGVLYVLHGLDPTKGLLGELLADNTADSIRSGGKSTGHKSSAARRRPQ